MLLGLQVRGLVSLFLYILIAFPTEVMIEMVDMQNRYMSVVHE